MTIGGSIFLIAIGAILRYAVEADLGGVNIDTVGVILMVAGGVGLVISLFFLAQNSRSGPPEDRYERRPPDDRPPPR